MPRKSQIKIVDVVDKDAENDDNYDVTVVAVKENQLSNKNEPLETTEETTAIIEEKDEGTPEEVSINTNAPEPTKK